MSVGADTVEYVRGADELSAGEDLTAKEFDAAYFSELRVDRLDSRASRAYGTITLAHPRIRAIVPLIDRRTLGMTP
ncbi:MAG: hypothetical protein ABIT61_13485 [Steroidobacteraceae bacterium]